MHAGLVIDITTLKRVVKEIVWAREGSILHSPQILIATYEMEKQGSAFGTVSILGEGEKNKKQPRY